MFEIPLIFASVVDIIVFAVMAIGAAVSYTSYQTAQKAARQAAQQATQKQRGVLYQVRATAMPRRLIYGRTRVGGIEDYVAVSGAENEKLHYILIWGDGPCEQMEALLFNGKGVHVEPIDSSNPDILVPVVGSPYHGLVRWESELGDNLLPPAHGLGIIPGWAESDKLRGICYSWVELTYDPEAFPNGVPQIGAILLGRKDVWDPRESTVKYTNNVALCLNHYLTLERLGPGLIYPDEVGEDELIAAANVCEELVLVSSGSPSNYASGETYFAVPRYEFRYTFDGVISLEHDGEEIIRMFRTAMAGTTVYVGGKQRIYAGAYQIPTFTVDQSIIVGPVSRKTRQSKRDRFNTVRGVYATEGTQWQPTDFPAYVDSNALEEDKEELAEDVDLLNTDSTPKCRRLAKIFLLRSRFSRQVTVPCNIEALRAQPGLTVTFDFPKLGFDNTPMDVMSWDFVIQDRKIQIMLNLRETDPSVYEWEDDGVGDNFTNLTNFPPPPQKPPVYKDLLDIVPSTVQLECQSRGDALAVCGFNEFTWEGQLAGSTPPKKYRKRLVSGEMDIGKYLSIPDGLGNMDPSGPDYDDGANPVVPGNTILAMTSDELNIGSGVIVPGALLGGGDLTSNVIRQWTQFSISGFCTLTRVGSTFCEVECPDVHHLAPGDMINVSNFSDVAYDTLGGIRTVSSIISPYIFRFDNQSTNGGPDTTNTNGIDYSPPGSARYLSQLAHPSTQSVSGATVTCCSSTYPGSGPQSGDVAVYYFSNSYYWVTVRLTLDSVDFDTGLAHYTFDGYTIGPGQTAPPGAMPPPTNYATLMGYGPISAGFQFTQNIGAIFTIAVSIQAIFGWGIGAWNYEAGVNRFTDTWDIDERYSREDCSFSVIKHETSRLIEGGGPGDESTPIPGLLPIYDQYEQDGRPDLFYQPYFTLLVRMEPYYVETITDLTHRTTEGMQCCINDSGFGVASIQADGTVVESLHEEDDDDDAIYRMRNAYPWAGQPWVPCGTYPCCSTIYESRTQFIFEYAEAKVRGTITFPTINPGDYVMVEINISKKDLATNVVSLGTSETFEATVETGGSVDIPEFEMPNEVGYEHFISSVVCRSIAV